MFKLQTPSKYSPFGAIYLLRYFLHCSKWFLHLLILMPFIASAIFCSLLPHRQNISLWGLFSSGGNKNTLLRARLVEWRRWGTGVMPILVKTCRTLSMLWADALISHLSWNGQTSWKGIPKNSLKPNSASYNNASWYTDTDRFLEYSPSGESLYYKGPTLLNIISFWGGFP